MKFTTKNYPTTSWKPQPSGSGRTYVASHRRCVVYPPNRVTPITWNQWEIMFCMNIPRAHTCLSPPHDYLTCVRTCMHAYAHSTHKYTSPCCLRLEPSCQWGWLLCRPWALCRWTRGPGQIRRLVSRCKVLGNYSANGENESQTASPDLKQGCVYEGVAWETMKIRTRVWAWSSRENIGKVETDAVHLNQ